MNWRIACWALVLSICLRGVAARAEVLSVNLVASEPGAVLPGHVANDIFLNFDTMLLGQQMSLQLTGGSIFQGAGMGSHTAPAAQFVEYVPELAYDSFVTVGGFDAGSSASVLMVGGAVDLAYYFDTKASKTLQFDTNTVDVAWAPSPGNHVLSGQNFLTGRITLSNDAQGTFRYLGSSAGAGDYWIGEAEIVNGTIGSLTRRVFEPVVVEEPPPVISTPTFDPVVANPSVDPALAMPPIDELPATELPPTELEPTLTNDPSYSVAEIPWREVSWLDPIVHEWNNDPLVIDHIFYNIYNGEQFDVEAVDDDVESLNSLTCASDICQKPASAHTYLFQEFSNWSLQLGMTTAYDGAITHRAGRSVLANVALLDSQVSGVPEPASAALCAIALSASMVLHQRSRIAGRH